jgi:hypothetical protein
VEIKLFFGFLIRLDLAKTKTHKQTQIWDIVDPSHHLCTPLDSDRRVAKSATAISLRII